jgi:ATP-binding cassette subfamily B protein
MSRSASGAGGPRHLVGTLRAVLSLTWEASRRLLLGTVILSMLAALVPPVLVWLGKDLVDTVVAGQASGATTADVIPTVVALGVATAALRALAVIQSHRQTLFATVVELHSERRLLERAAQADLGYFDDPEWHDRAARATRNVSWRPASVAYALTNVAGSMVTMAGMFALLIPLSPWLALLSLLSVLPPAFAQHLDTRRNYEFWHRSTTSERQRNYLRDLLSAPPPAMEVRAFDLAPHLLRRHEAITGSRVDNMRRMYARSDRTVAITSLASGAALAAAYGLVASRGINGELTAGDLALVIGVFAAAGSLFGTLFRSIFDISESASFLEDYFSFLRLERIVPVADDPVPLPPALDAGIRLQNVTFTYPTGEAPALEGINLQVRPGELLALVGENGAGKTTLIKLLLRFYDPDDGGVSIGGVDLCQADPADVRRRIGVLFQDFIRFEFSARDNVTLGRVERQATDEATMAALDAARAGGVLKGPAATLDSPIGRLFEGGHDLSGGEWQRLALARLLFRDPDIWILDEPTASLDAEAEAAVFANIRAVLQNRIGIIISHRFSTVRVADRIAVMAEGRIAEIGTHDELLAAGGTYARLFELQAAGYR